MKHHQPRPIVEEFPASDGFSCSCAMFDRTGGVSNGHFDSLNIGFNVGDSEENVVENRHRVKDLLSCDTLLSATQVHGDALFCLREPLQGDRRISDVDGLITGETGVGLMIQQADCQAILLYDAGKKVIAAVHSGWRGSVLNIASKAVATMITEYGSDPIHIHARISPSLGPCCAEFINYKTELPSSFYPYMVRSNYFDFPAISKRQLMECGIPARNIQHTGICTSCTDDYFSYRRACRTNGGITGRNCSVIILRK